MRLLITTVSALALLVGFAYGHSGGLDARGGHSLSRIGKYHCHRAGSEEGAGRPLESASRGIISVSSDSPRVIDGDTLQLGSERVRLYGIDVDNRLEFEASKPKLNEDNSASDSILSRILNKMMNDFASPDEIQWGMAYLMPEGDKLYYRHPVICERLCMKRKPEDLDYRLVQINHRRINDLGYLSGTLGIMMQYFYKGFFSMTLNPDRKNFSLSSDKDFEIGLEIGLRFYKPFLDAFAVYTDSSIGPMYTTRRFEDQATERGNVVMTPFTSLGFAFGNFKGTRITVSSYWRHFSKDGIYRGENDGIDLNIWELGIIYRM